MSETPEVASPKNPTVAYVPYRTFMSALESLTQGVPHQIDRSIFPSLSGVTQSQLLGSLRFLGLISADGKPTPDLQKLVEDKANRKEHLRRVLTRSYPTLIELDLSKVTPAGLDAAFKGYGLTGETNVKAKSFFLQAAKEAGITLSPYLLKATRASVPRRKKNGAKEPPPKPALPNNEDALFESIESTSPGVKKVVYLDNNAVLSLILDRNFGELPSKQRKFVNELIDRMEEFTENAIAEEEREMAEREARQKSQASS